jgi:uncharacterized protein (DUF433 family)
VDWQTRIVLTPESLGGKPVVRRTRLSVEFVVDLLARGWSAERVLEQCPQLVAENILAYAAHTLRAAHVYPVPR